MNLTRIGPTITSVRSLRWTLRSRLAEHPAIYLPIARRKYHDSVLGDDTRLVVDGFTRSAVTFATIAFQMAQRRPVRVAHTLHATGHLTAAARRGVPTLVTIREPEEDVLSAVIREPYVTLAQALTAYTRFYTKLQPFRSDFVVGEFSAVTGDFGSVIRRVNQRFGCDFDEFEHTKANVEQCYAVIEARSQRPPWSKALGEFECGIIGFEEYRRIVAVFEREGWLPQLAVPEHRVQRPSEERESLKNALRAELGGGRLSGRVTDARHAYAAFVAD